MTSSALAAQRRWLSYRRQAAAGAAEIAPPDITIGVAASFTAEPLDAYVGSRLLDADLRPAFTFAEYNQIHQVCFDSTAALGPVDCLIVLWRLEDMFESALERASEGAPEAVEEITTAVGELGDAIAAMASSASFPVIVSVPPHPRPIGVDGNDSIVAMRLARVHDVACRTFLSALEGTPVQWADLSAWQLTVGVERSHDVVKAMAYRQPYTTEFWDVVGSHLADIVIRERVPPPKCIVLDCDNTLWGGVVGEDGLGGIALGSAFPGSGYAGFQQALAALKRRGVLLAIASKNNPKEVDDVFTMHDAMVLKKDDIAAWRVNWNAKSQSLREIAAELNIGVDALLMIDDSHYELAEIANGAPEVRRLQVPEEPALLPDLLAASSLFRNMTVSAEDLNRTEMMAQEAGRKRAATEMSREEFLASLDLQLDYIEVAEEHVGRVAQLTNKTNQFNLTTVRRSEADIRALLASDRHVVRAIRVADKFGDYGLVGVAIVATDGVSWDIDTLLMSCRVLSRGIETAFLASLAAEAERNDATALIGHYIPTQKNQLVADLYTRHGFTETEAGTYRAVLSDLAPTPPYVKVR